VRCLGRRKEGRATLGDVVACQLWAAAPVTGISLVRPQNRYISPSLDSLSVGAFFCGEMRCAEC